MDHGEYKNRLSFVPFGKKVHGSLYVLEKSLLKTNPELYTFVKKIKTVNVDSKYNVIKFDKYRYRITFLSYPEFFSAPHPTLKHSITIDLATGTARDTARP